MGIHFLTEKQHVQKKKECRFCHGPRPNPPPLFSHNTLPLTKYLRGIKPHCVTHVVKYTVKTFQIQHVFLIFYIKLKWLSLAKMINFEGTMSISFLTHKLTECNLHNLGGLAGL
jgi:hypothetical protein